MSWIALHSGHQGAAATTIEINVGFGGGAGQPSTARLSQPGAVVPQEPDTRRLGLMRRSNPEGSQARRRKNCRAVALHWPAMTPGQALSPGPLPRKASAPASCRRTLGFAGAWASLAKRGNHVRKCSGRGCVATSLFLALVVPAALH